MVTLPSCLYETTTEAFLPYTSHCSKPVGPKYRPLLHWRRVWYVSGISRSSGFPVSYTRSHSASSVDQRFTKRLNSSRNLVYSVPTALRKRGILPVSGRDAARFSTRDTHGNIRPDSCGQTGQAARLKSLCDQRLLEATVMVHLRPNLTGPLSHLSLLRRLRRGILQALY
ncbi:hypothetical protein BJX96DRAFT_154085 [Aspergillus floccosus]